MTESSHRDHASQGRSTERTIQSITEAFESAWQAARGGGPPPTIATYLSDASEPERSAIRTSLEQIDQRYREQLKPDDLTQDAKSSGHEPEAPAEGAQTKLQTVTDDASGKPPGVATTVDFLKTVGDEQERPGEAGTKELPAIAGYEILDELGHGAMGVVYRARQEGLKRVVALKMILAGSHARPGQLARFQTEAEAVAQLQHPNIVQIHEVGQHGRAPFFSLEFVDGGSLQEKIGGKPMEAPDAAQLTETLARAMHYAHQRAIVHRDLKPGNVLLTTDGVPKISDFGLAKRLEGDSGQTKSGTIVGTPSYMAPEQARGAIREIGPLADVYALGAILYALFTGRPPFMAANTMDTVMQVLHQEPVPPTRLQPKVPSDLETICLKCLQKDSQKRYGSAEELAEDLRRFSAGEPILARPVSSWERFWRWCRRNPRVAALSAVVASLALTVVIGSPIAALWINREKNAALDAEAEAEAARIVAVNSEKFAWEQAELALDAYQTLVGEVQDQLADRPAMQDLRLALLNIAVEKLTDVARKADNANLLDKELAKAHQRIGWIFQDLGQTSLALKQHQQAHEIIEALAAKAPEDPIVAKRHPAATNNILGDMYLRLGKLAEARQHYVTALELRKEWVRSNPEALEAELAVANSYGLLGKVSLMLGDPARAHEEFLESLNWHKKLPKYVQRRVGIRRQWAGLYDRLADANSKLGDGSEGEKQYMESLEIRQSLAGLNPQSVLHRQDLVISYVNLGDLRLQLFDDPGGAEEYYQQALELVDKLIQDDPRSAFAQRALSVVDYRLGTTNLRLDKPDEAGKYYQECLQRREALAQLSPEDVSAQIDLMLVLARCGEHQNAAPKADGFRERFPTNPWVLYHVACCYSLCASAVTAAGADRPLTEKEQTLGQQYTDKAVEVLQEVLDHDWKDLVSLQNDPDLDPIHGHPGYTALLDKTRRTVSDAEKE